MNYFKSIFVTPLYYSIGNAAEEIMWASARAKLTCEKLIIVPPFKFTQLLGYKICNDAIFRVEAISLNKFTWLDVLIINIATVYVNFRFIFKRLIAKISKKYTGIGFPENWNFPDTGKSKFWPTVNGYDYKKIREDRIVDSIHRLEPLSLPYQLNEDCRKIISNFDFSGKKFVCLHVREDGYHHDGGRRAYRNAKISSYYPAIKYLLSEGMYVIRMGDPSMEKANIDHKYFFDYPFSDIKSDSMDLFLIRNCEFYIGMQSGILDVAHMFNKPILILNMYDWFFNYPLKTNDRGMLKKIKIKSGASYKTYSSIEWFQLPFFYTNNREIYDERVQFIDNSEKEILSATEEYYKDYLSGWSRPLTDNMINSKEEFRKASDNILSGKNMHAAIGFNKLPLLHRIRISLRNISSKGCLYDFS